MFIIEESNISLNDDNLNDLLVFIGGKGRFWILGNGIHTYPDGDDNQKRIYEGCVELEKRGKVYRFIDEPGHVCFKEHT